MMPTLLLKDGRVITAIGASGSTRIPTSLMQVLYRLKVERKSLYESITEPKLHAEAETIISDEDLQYIAEPLANKLRLKYVKQFQIQILIYFYIMFCSLEKKVFLIYYHNTRCL